MGWAAFLQQYSGFLSDDYSPDGAYEALQEMFEKTDRLGLQDDTCYVTF
jgi:hypothetical protein